MITICPKCGKEFENNTNRKFCTRSCANSHIQTKEQNYSRKLKRKKKYLNPQNPNYRKLLQELIDKKEEKLPYFGICSRCGKEFIFYKKGRKNCDDCKCNKGLHYKVKNSSKMGGIREKGGKTKNYIKYINKLNEEMILNLSEYEVAKYLDRLNLKWHRNWKGFEYIDLLGRKRKYYPDFYVEDFDLYIEYKGWINKENSHKMKSALENNNFKLKIIYSSDQRYKNLGLNLDQIKDNNINLLLE